MFRLSLALAILFMVAAPGVPSARDATASAKSQTSNVGGAVKHRRTIHRRAAYRAESAAGQRSCGEYMYWKDGKCNDARNKPTKQ
jgi:hypothetical protein